MAGTDGPDPVAVSAVEIDDDFWSPWIERNRETTIEHQYRQLEESGTLENFRRVIDGKEGGFQGMWFQDSDAYKWIEAASYVLATHEDPELLTKVDAVIDLIEEAQEESGYLNTYFQLVEPDGKWTNLHIMHELYCAGHLLEAAVAHHTATGDDRLLSVATRFADHIDAVFPEEVDGVPGHEEIELGLIRLHRKTGEERYLDLARYFVDRRGREDRLAWEANNLDDIAGGQFDTDAWEGALDDASRNLFLDEDGEYDGSYAQAHLPLREQEAVEGHSVRAMYLFAAATDLARETDDEELRSVLEGLWENMTTKRMYLTGGIGSTAAHEGFTEDYDLPNEEAYAETCAAVGSVFWNQRLFELTTEAKYHDLLERTLYNGFLAGVSMDGTRFFYENPLASSGDHHRKGWFTCACCPPNAARLLASLGRYVYATDDDAVYVNQYVGSRVETHVDGERIELAQSGSLPWKGTVEVTVERAPRDGVTVHLRRPAWAASTTIAVNGERVERGGEGYVTLDLAEGDEVSLGMELEIERVRAHPAVESDAGRIAIERGPIVYCAEAVDNERPLHHYAIPGGADPEVAHDANVLEGVTTIETDAEVPGLDGWGDELYRSDSETERESARLELVPYYAWDNRAPGAMRVWIRSP